MNQKPTLKQWIIVIWYAIKGFFVNIKNKIFQKSYYRSEKGECILNYCNKIIENDFELSENDHIYAYDEFIENFRLDLVNTFGIQLSTKDAVIIVRDQLASYSAPI